MLPVIASKAMSSLAAGGTVAKILKAGFYIATLGVGYLLFKRILRKSTQNKTASKFGDDSKNGRAVGYATQFYQAFFTTYEWFSKIVGDGTDYKAVMATADQIHADKGVSFKDVSSTYKKLFNRNLLLDLKDELDSTEFGEFSKAIKSGLGSIAVTSHLLISKKPVTVLDSRFEPISLVQPGVVLGEHTQTMINANNQQFYGFEYKGQERFVPKEMVIAKSI